MNVTTVPRFAIKTSLTLVRIPIDVASWALSTLTGSGDSRSPHEEALAHEAASERESAAALRARARATRERADERYAQEQRADERYAQEQRAVLAEQRQAASAQERAE